MVARPDLFPFFPTGFRVLGLDDLSVVFQNIGHALSRQDALPQVISLAPVRVGRIASAVVPPEIERQKPRGLALETRAETHFVIVHREVADAAAKLKELLAPVAVALVLLNRVFDRLLRKTVL